MNHDNFSALRAFATTPEYYGPQGTISMAETSLMTPTSPESYKSSSKEDDKKPTKKRKSWGQELPTPKTNLPPRKRAKTEDEKEQRRIERVLRNRQAAQSSRERKRQEVEKLEGEKYSIERQNYMLKQRLLAVEHEKYALRQQLAKYAAALQKAGTLSRAVSVGPAPSSPPSPNMVAADLRQLDRNIKQEFEDLSFSLPSPQNTLDPRSSFSSASPSSSRSASPSNLDFNGSVTSPDMTQHPAAMLCGLQCQSGAAWRPSSNPDGNSTNTYNTSPLSDASFCRLFESPTTTQPTLNFFEDGLAHENLDDDANTFSFDSMVDLDAGQSSHISNSDDQFITFHQHDQHNQDHFDILSSANSVFGFPHQPAATSSGLQPCLGASS
ncbi:hypothetical protein MMC17_004957 [Xylographa soralifera]|nr:hypothetical protein [Xylographa soralifera]